MINKYNINLLPKLIFLLLASNSYASCFVEENYDEEEAVRIVMALSLSESQENNLPADRLQHNHVANDISPDEQEMLDQAKTLSFLQNPEFAIQLDKELADDEETLKLAIELSLADQQEKDTQARNLATENVPLDVMEVKEEAIRQVGEICQVLSQEYKEKLKQLEQQEGYHPALQGMSAFRVIDIEYYAHGTFPDNVREQAENHIMALEKKARALGWEPNKEKTVARAVANGMDWEMAGRAYDKMLNLD